MRNELLKEMFRGEGWQALKEVLWDWKLELLQEERHRVAQGAGTALLSEGALQIVEKLLDLPRYTAEVEKLQELEKAVQAEAERAEASDETPSTDDGY